MWINEYEDLMFSYISDDNKTFKAVDIKYDNMPNIFYKYRSVNKNTIEALNNDLLYFSAISLFNDPYECFMSMSNIFMKKVFYNTVFYSLKCYLKPNSSLSDEDFSSQEILLNKIVEQMINPPMGRTSPKMLWKDIDDHLNKHLKDSRTGFNRIGEDVYRVCSFSELNDSLLMWAHYADNHRGFCIGYDFKELNNDLTELLLPVIYSDNLIDISKYIFNEENKSLIIKAITRKSKVWEYEKEWRIVITSSNDEKKQSLKMPVPKSIFLGARIDDNNKKEIIRIAKQKNIDVNQMYMKEDTFNLGVKKIFGRKI